MFSDDKQDNLEAQHDDDPPRLDTAADKTVHDDGSFDNHSSGVTTTEIGGTKIHINEKQLPLIVITLAASVLLVALLVDGSNTKNYTYGLVVAIGAMVGSVTGIIYHGWWSETKDAAADFLAYFLFVWCFVGACVLTFLGPFEYTGNGYFAAWAMVVGGTMAIGISRSLVKEHLSGFTGSILGLGASSVTIICDVVNEFEQPYLGEAVYCFCVAVLSIFVVAGFYIKQHTTGETGGNNALVVFLIFSALWIALAFVATFRGPFQVTGNGYFGSWAGAVVSVYAGKSAHHHRDH